MFVPQTGYCLLISRFTVSLNLGLNDNSISYKSQVINVQNADFSFLFDYTMSRINESNRCIDILSHYEYRKKTKGLVKDLGVTSFRGKPRFADETKTMSEVTSWSPTRVGTIGMQLAFNL
uniref:Uncharacterized protein n=1 Tax=Strigamia maritima TaxID=126957 RepID=T1JIW2_STRMM